MIIGILGLFGGSYYIATTIESSISASIQSTNTNNNAVNQVVHLPGAGDAQIHTGFAGGASQACWYYFANYETSHPYTVLWDVSKEGTLYPKIRVIADKGTWKAERCIKIDKKAKLIGLETIEHRLEAQFVEGGEFFHIANTEATYHSALHFNDQGRIIHRRIMVSPEKEENGYINKMVSKRFSKQDDKQYDAAYELYVEKRSGLHENLKDSGCGAISIQPDFINIKTQELEKPSIIYICHKDGQKSHVRIMQRVDSENDKAML
ncbi:MAG: hypothetical protein H6936_06885 [Burkholderiales bacterium]|nr:hypothetical protein [Nitrosomonas sp.]MCP5274566.1 hypothetical protein [Burkholderiales bacterium]